MHISKTEREAVLNILQKMIYSSSEERYMQLYEEFLASSPVAVCRYFQENWHNIRHEWVREIIELSH